MRAVKAPTRQSGILQTPLTRYHSQKRSLTWHKSICRSSGRLTTCMTADANYFLRPNDHNQEQASKSTHPPPFLWHARLVPHVEPVSIRPSHIHESQIQSVNHILHPIATLQGNDYQCHSITFDTFLPLLSTFNYGSAQTSLGNETAETEALQPSPLPTAHPEFLHTGSRANAAYARKLGTTIWGRWNTNQLFSTSNIRA